MDEYSECAFCNEPIDYCQGHGSMQYAVREQADGMIVSQDLFETEDEAFAEFDRLTHPTTPGHTVDIFDQAGDVSASYTNPDHE